jgi:N6-adenosine-specific RNA methylase IME4
MSGVAFHPLAGLFPLIEGEEFAALVDDIRERGQLHLITLFQGQILDGRNRFLACQAIDVEPKFQSYEGDDPLAHVLSLNEKRRHSNASQRSMVAAKLANLDHGVRADRAANLPVLAPVTQPSAASMLNVSERSVRDAVKVKDKGQPEIVHAVEQGRLAVSEAAKAVELDPDMQREIAAQAAAGDTRTVRHLVAKATRARHEHELGARQRELPDRRFGVIYADPPWAWTAYSELGLGSSPEMHYTTMSVEAIAALPVASITADDAALFNWVTGAHLENAFAVMRAWGFAYKSNAVWVKNKAGLGYWFRSAHEHLLIGTRGNIRAPAQGSQARSVINADVGRHSEKPAEFYRMIESYYPSLFRVELFARGPARPGWENWGNEAEPPLIAADIEPAGSDQ